MTNTYNTGNPLGSTDPRDLLDNASNLDDGMNSALPTFVDRLGVSRDTWKGMQNAFALAQSGRASAFDAAQGAREAEFQQFLTDSGFVSLGNYAPGLNFTAYNQYMARDGFFYRPAPSTIPFTTTGTWGGGDEDLFVLMSEDAVLRQDLNALDYSQGATLVRRAVRQVDSMSDLQVLSARNSRDVAYLSGWSSTAPGKGSGIYVWDAADTRAADNGAIVAVTGVPTGRWVRQGDTADFFVWGAVGDGVADDQAAINAAFDSDVPIISGAPGAVFRTTLETKIERSMILDLHGGELFYDSALTQRNLWVLADSVTIHNGKISTVVAGGTGAGHGQHNCPLNAGIYETGVGHKNLEFRDLIIETNKPGGVALSVIGDCDNVMIENIRLVNAATVATGVQVHWGGIDYAVAATVGTTHPRNVKVNNVTAQGLALAGSSLLVVSGAYNVKAENIKADTCDRLVTLFCGDYGMYYAADTSLATRGVHNIELSKMSCPAAKLPVYVDMFATARPSPGKEKSYNIRIEQVSAKASAPTDASSPGARVRYADNVALLRCDFDGFYSGVWRSFSSFHLSVIDCDLRNSWASGFSDTGDASGPAFYGEIVGNRFTANNQSSGANIPDLLLSWGGDTVIRDNLFDSVNASNCVRVNTGATISNRNVIEDNLVINISASGTAFLLGASTDTTVAILFDGNRFRSASSFPSAKLADGQALLPFAISTKSGTANRLLRKFKGAAIPTVGTFQVGDTVEFTDPVAAGHIGAVCTAAGTPGTWKNYGAIVA